jgi:hypothetical protein
MAMREAQGAAGREANEAGIVQAASRILAALIRNGRLTNGNHASLIRSAVEMALELARETDRILNGAGEAAGDKDILDLLDE